MMIMTDGIITSGQYTKSVLEEIYRHWPESESAIGAIFARTDAGRRFTVEEFNLIKAALSRFESMELRLERAKNLCQGCYCVFLMRGKGVPEELATAYQECCEIALDIWQKGDQVGS
jgi:hypothetical protein